MFCLSLYITVSKSSKLHFSIFDVVIHGYFNEVNEMSFACGCNFEMRKTSKYAYVIYCDPQQLYT